MSRDWASQEAFLEADPPHWAARGLTYILVASFVVLLLVSVVLKIPETISSPFVLIPIRGTDPVRALRGGTVTEIHVAEGQTVARGAAILVIRSAEVGDRSSEFRTLETQLSSGPESLANAIRKRESERLAQQKEIQKLEEHRVYLDQTIVLKKEQLSVAKEQLERAQKLREEGLASWVEYTNYQLKAGQGALELQQSEAERKETLANIDKVRHESDARDAEFRESKRSLQENAEKSRIRMGALHADLIDSKGNELSVTAPCSGSVLRLRGKGPGAIVREGDVLCEVACSTERLQAELTVPQSGLALIRPGQPVKLLYDAFPYQRYGVRHGVVRWTSPASVSVNDAPAFRVLADISEETVSVNGQPRPLMAGMGGTARVVVGRRSLISYAFEPLRQLRENLAEPPKQGSPESSR